MDSMEELLILLPLGIFIWILLRCAESANAFENNKKTISSEVYEAASLPEASLARTVMLNEYNNEVKKNKKLMDLLTKLDHNKLCLIKTNVENSKLPLNVDVEKLVHISNMMNKQLENEIRKKISLMKEKEAQTSKSSALWEAELQREFYGASFTNSSGSLYLSNRNEKQRGSGSGY